jgi:DNA-binding NarL/FixJ family response regulator
MEGLTVRYGDTIAVDGLDLRIEPGETVALLGPNGAGKSSTVNAALGLFRPAGGRVLLRGRAPAEAIRAGGVGAMLQHGGLPSESRVGEVLAVSCPEVRAVVLTTFGRPGFLRRAMEVGAAGFLVKDSPVAELARAIRAVMAGERVIDRDLAAAALALGATPLSAREADVLRAAADGATVADIAGRLFLSEGTVRNYLSSAIGKTDARTRVEAARVAQEKGWL